MEAELKKILKAVTLELRHLLEGRYDASGKWQPGDLEQRLAAIGVRRDRASVPVDELGHLTDEDRHARKVVDAYLNLREVAGVERAEAVSEFVRETAYTWANRLLALRCMEARELIDPVILQQEAYGGRSLEHHRLAQRSPELCAGEDDGLFAVLDKVFREQTGRLPMLFDPHAPGIALRPSPAALKDCFGLLSLNPETLRKYRIRLKEDDGGSAESASPFTAPDALGWAYQYWNIEEKDRVFEKVRTVKGAKIAGSDIVPATQLYTENYMVKFLVQNSLGATWTGMYPDSKLSEGWEYYVKDADRAPVERKPVAEITFLDPACGSGHFLLEAFDLFYAMYEEEGELTEPEAICNAILTQNLFGIDIDPRSVQIAEAALWMKAAERAFDYAGAATHLVAATASHLKGPSWEEFLASFQKEPSVARVLRKFAASMEHIDEIGSLARPAEDLREIIGEEHATWERQVREQKEANYLFPEFHEEALSGHLPFHEISDEEFGERLFYRAKAGIDAFTERAREAGEFEDQLLGSETRAGFRLVDLLSRQYDVVAANPPYMGSPSMGDRLRDHLKNSYSLGANDLFAAFILRCCELTRQKGTTAMVTQQSWLFLRDYAPLRSGKDQGLFNRYVLELVAPLGPNAFEEITGEVVSAALFVLRLDLPTPTSTITGIRVNQRAESPQKADSLQRAAKEGVCLYSVTADDLASIPESPAVFWLGGQLFTLLKSKVRVAAHFDVRQGLATTDDSRFVRWWWETPASDALRWYRFVKGGGYRKWWGFNSSRLDWQHDGARLKLYVVEIKGNKHWSRRLASSEFYFREGLTYSDVASGCLGARVMPSRSLFAASSPGIFKSDDSKISWSVALGLLNSRLATFLARTTSPNPMHFSVGYVANLPFLPNSDGPLEELVETVTTLKRGIDSMPIVSDEHIPQFSLVLDDVDSRIRDRLDREVAILLIEAMVDSRVCELFQLDDETKDTLSLTLGSLAGSYPCSADAANYLHGVRFLPNDVLTAVRRHVAQLTQAGTVSLNFRPVGLTPEDTDDSEEDETNAAAIADLLNECHSFPNEFRLESLCQEQRVNPVALLTTLMQTGEYDRQIREPFRQAEVFDRVSTALLLLLGHNWPGQHVNEAFLPDDDGILPLFALSQSTAEVESTLLSRLRQSWRRLAGNDVAMCERVFESVAGMSLDTWLVTEFFKHHTKQFKKRPIAWQLQSGKFTARKSPAFACLVYYHKLDADTLPKLRSQYVGPLRQRLETELRGIQAVPADARSDRQEKRRVELEDAISELTAFDAKLEQVVPEGFAFTGLAKLLADEPLDRWCSLDGKRPHPTTTADLLAQESAYAPDINDGVRVNIAPLQKAGLLAADVLAKKDMDKAIADRASWRADERRWVREGKLPQPGWWPSSTIQEPTVSLPQSARLKFQSPGQYPVFVLLAMLQQSGGATALVRLARAYSLLAFPAELVNNAPLGLGDIARDWAEKFTESPEIGFFRDAVLDLVKRDQINGMTFRSGTVSLVGNGANLSSESWVNADAALALAIVDGMPSAASLDGLPESVSSQVRALMAG